MQPDSSEGSDCRKAHYCGNGSRRAIVKAFTKGRIDIPFSTSHTRLERLTARDSVGAVRFLSTGNLQFDRELRDFHQCKIGERRRAEGLSKESDNYVLVEQDVMRVPRDEYVRWPLAV